MASQQGIPRELPTPPSEETISLLFKRILPILVLGYILNFIDRTNISMVKSELQTDIGIDAAAYGLGSGLFFLTYAFFQIPSNLIMSKIGARWTLGTVMTLWGLLSMGTAFIHTTAQFYTLRLLLGLVESGFYPGVLYYITIFFPHSQRTRANSIFLMGAAMANIIGNPLAGLIVGLHGTAGLPGWQWLFILEGIPTVLLGVVLLLRLPDRPTEAKWLAPEPAQQLEAYIKYQNETGARNSGNYSLWKSACDPQILLNAVVFFTVVIGVYALGYFLPAIIRTYSSALTTFEVGLITAVPYVVGAISLWVVPKLVKPGMTKTWIVSLIIFISIGLIIALLAQRSLGGWFGPVVAIIGFCIAYAATQTCQPMILASVGFRLSGAALAAGLALVNMVGQLGGFFGPYILGFAEQQTGSPSSGLWAVVVIALIGAILASITRVSPTATDASGSGEGTVSPSSKAGPV
ncbi:MFS transporter [Brenneria izadpanahii]|uniref:MFS transporter n=1 Tax=Brenneria izadpanahii TaxID=2722756 RepID=A0ABX7URG6_9GAMM|nr:MFS transporter [Brenneria izadpanahii]QTF07935.1 MFS transporter [Brenneria izadpanahii]